MPSIVQICNVALTAYIGASRINSLSEDSPEARACDTHYDDVVRWCLEAYWWNFATGRQVLAQLTNDRDEWEYRYQMPSDALQIRWVNDPETARLKLAQGQSPDITREITGTDIYCDLEDAACEYTKAITDPTLFPQSFADAVSAQLATRIVLPLTEDNRRANSTFEIAQRNLEEAFMRDARNTPPFTPGLPSYLTARGLS
jgi:hypothetical protein